MENQPIQEDDNQGLPPLFKTWKQLYITLVVYLLALIVLFYWFTVFFR